MERLSTMAKQFVRLGAVASAAAIFASTASEVQANDVSHRLIVTNDGTACAVTDVKIANGKLITDEKIYSAQGTTGPAPESIDASSAYAQSVISALDKSADYATGLLEKNDKIAIKRDRDGVCTVSRISGQDGKTILYQNVISGNGIVSGPVPEVVSAKDAQMILKNADEVIEAK